ncbi:MAG: translationally-controlled tumor protein [Amphiamblys sp. WSBS2006]|nr:MAG: translationally-controlled tumor protein [Amphiamblys sp. WSBS2006]
MIIYKDIFSGDELLSDSFKKSLVDDVVYEVECSVTTASGVKVNIGGNPSAEGGEEGYDDKEETHIDIVYSHRLTETAPFGKKDYLAYIKGYLKRVKEVLKEKNPSRVEAFEKGASVYIKKVLKEIDGFSVFLGESEEMDAMVVLVGYRESGDPYAVVWRDGLVEEKQ